MNDETPKTGGSRATPSAQPGLPFLEDQGPAEPPITDQPEHHDASALIPDEPSLPRLREAAAECKACNLWTRGTQTVFGEGERKATVMFVGEQPGDKEDLAGRLTLPTSSNISNGCRVVSGGFMRSRIRLRSTPVAHGSTQRSR